jgi:nucleotide-binding universal stress UspA family protein
MDIKSILFPTDFSEGSSQALQYAIEIVKRFDAKLFLIHVVHEVRYSGGFFVPHTSMDVMYDEVVQSAQKELDKYGIEEMRGLKSAVERRVIRGVPHEEIVNFAKENKIDLIIIGAHGKKGMETIFFGNTTSHVVRHAPCSVLTGRHSIH